MDAAKRGAGVLLPKLREQFYSRVEAAFDFLEEQVAQGKLQAYGVSSNTLGAPASRADATSVSTFWEVAEKVAQKRGLAPNGHHFRLLQLPLNLYESGPAEEKNTGERGEQTALECASKLQLAVLANRPLNAFTRQHMVRLADFTLQAETRSIPELLETVAELEKEFAEKIAPSLELEGGEGKAADLFQWARDLTEVQSVGLGVDRWSQVENQILHHVLYLCEKLAEQLKTGPWASWQSRYLPALKLLLAAFRNEANQRTQKNSDRVREKLDPFLPESWKAETLSRKALGVLIHTPGVSCVLNGMRTPAYVHDSLGATKLPRLSEIAVRKIFTAFK
jgi:aryl-alcohol dehydrogenase-like predicted oxidoreductase